MIRNETPQIQFQRLKLLEAVYSVGIINIPVFVENIRLIIFFNWNLLFNYLLKNLCTTILVKL